MSTPSVAVIGAGASGTLLCRHLLRHVPPGTRITLIERKSPFGPGLAYATGNPNHLLNVPAGRMSAFADQPHHFLDWLAVSVATVAGWRAADRSRRSYRAGCMAPICGTC